MKLLFKLILIILLIIFLGKYANSEPTCWNEKKNSEYSLQKKLVSKLESFPYNSWNIDSSNDVITIIHNNRENKKYIVSINSWGSLTINTTYIDVSFWLRNRLRSLYKKIYCNRTSEVEDLLGGILDFL